MDHKSDINGGPESNDSLALDGPKILLRAPAEADIGHFVKWSNDPELRRLTAETAPMSVAEAKAFIDKVRNDADRRWFIIVDKRTGNPIGECGLLRIFWPWKTADLTMIIGQKEFWGKGHSDEAMGFLLDLAFNSLKLHRLSVGVLETNERAIRFYKRFGFKEEGRQRDGYLSNGKYHDFVMMSLLGGR